MAYRRVESRIWNDERFRALTDDGKLVFLFLLTHPHMTSVGAMRATSEGLAAELKWTVERFENGFETVLEARMVEFDPGACMVSLPNFIKHNPPANPNMVKGWVYALELLPECALKHRVINRCANRIETNAGWVSEGLAKPFRNTELEQETEQEQEKSLSLPPLKAGQQQSTTSPSSTKAARRSKLELTELPEAWLTWAAEKHQWLDARAEFERFRNHHASKGSLMADWPAAWRTWCGRAGEFAGRGVAPDSIEERNARVTWKPPEDDEPLPTGAP